MSRYQPDPPPRRDVVVSPRRTRPGRPRLKLTHEIDAQTRLGQVFLGSLVRAQFRLAMLVLALVGVLMLGLPLVFALAPEVKTLQVFGIPLPWLILGVLVHPAMIAAAWYYVRQAERTERDFAEMVARE